MRTPASRLVIELHYFPGVYWFALAAKSNELILEAHEHYTKQTFRNRCYILAANKIDRLSVPVVNGKKDDPVTAVRIDYRQKWQNQHWRAIASAYGKAPFFEFYEDIFKQLIYSNEEFLFSLNKKIAMACLQMLQLPVKTRHSDSYLNKYGAGFTDKRDKILPNRANGTVTAIAYPQLFSEKFVPGLSILDLLFNEGSNAPALVCKQLE